MKKYQFRKAVPVWQTGMDKEMNYNLVFRTIVDKAETAVVNISASNMYQMFVNGIMVAEGPARASHNYYRVDEIDVASYLTKDKNIISIIVDSYYVKNFYLIQQPGFLCAEVIADGEVNAATGDSGFEAKYHSGRLRYVDRYSYQRTFTEAYRLGPDYKDFETKVDCHFEPVELVLVGEKNFIERGVPYPCYNEHVAQQLISRGEFIYLPKPDEYNMSRWLTLDIDNVGQGYTRDVAEVYVVDEIDKCKCTSPVCKPEPMYQSEISSNAYAIYDMGLNKTGFIMLDITCDEDTEIILSYDEVLINEDISTRRQCISNGIVWFLKQGSYTLVANEPSTQRYIKIANKSAGAVTVNRLAIMEFKFPYKPNSLGSSNQKLNIIYDAAVESFRQNVVDIYMDCPSRERAGWLCDSYFIAQVEHHLTGKSIVEHNFLENFVMVEEFSDIQEGMIAMCYPADFPSHQYIPNWAMWYVLQLGEYLERSGDKEMIDNARNQIMKLYHYFETLRNSDGLLENLESTVFVERSKADEFTQDVNYPSNMLYATMLRTMGKLYDAKYIVQAEEMENTIREQSFYDGFFHDHAVRGEDGTLTVVDADVTETCQYYAFFTNIATPDTYPELWNTMLTDFGADRTEKGLWKEIYPSDLFFGVILRLFLLERYGKTDKLIENIEGYFYDMAERTGTLWEQITPTISCCQNIESIVSVWLDRYAK